MQSLSAIEDPQNIMNKNQKSFKEDSMKKQQSIWSVSLMQYMENLFNMMLWTHSQWKCPDIFIANVSGVIWWYSQEWGHVNISIEARSGNLTFNVINFQKCLVYVSTQINK